MKIITEEAYNTSFPIMNEDYVNGLSAEDKIKYFELSTIYRKLLNEYIKKLGLSKSDMELSSSELNFIPTREEDQDIYQYYCNCDLKYYYVRNNTYIERLSNEDINYLKSKLDDNTFDNYASNFIFRTMETVISEHFPDIDGPVETNFGPSSTSFYALNNSLVIGFRYDEYNLNGMSDDEWDINNDNQKKLFWHVNDELEKQLSMQLNIPLKIIKYDDNSIKKNKITVEDERRKVI